MSAFARGMQMGQMAWNSAEEARIRNEELGLRKAADARAAEMHGLQTDGLRREAARQTELTGIRRQMSDVQQGINRPETNAAIDADFEAADQANLRGMPMPAVRGGSNAANEAALTVRKPVDVNAPEFQSSMAGLRSQYALAAGDMKDFDAVQAGERTRINAASDAEFARTIMADPAGEAAKKARSFINTQSRRISSKVGKDGFTTFAIVNGDGYDEVKLSPSDLGKVAVGYNRLARGDVGGLDIISAVNKDLAAVVREEMKLDLDVGRTNNDVAAKRGALANDTARTNIAAQGLRLRQQEVNDRRTAGSLENDINGVLEGYQAAVAAGPEGQKAAAIYAREYDQLRAIAGQRGLKVPPSLPALNAAQKGTGAKPVKVEDPGQRYLVDGELRVTDGRGGYMAENGVLPDDRGAALAKAGVPQALIPQLRWNQDGTAVGFRGRAYDMNDPQDIRSLISDARRLGANDIAVEEAQRQPHQIPQSTGFGPRIQYAPDPRAPSIYAGPEDWANYRLLQQNR